MIAIGPGPVIATIAGLYLYLKAFFSKSPHVAHLYAIPLMTPLLTCFLYSLFFDLRKDYIDFNVHASMFVTISVLNYVLYRVLRLKHDNFRLKNIVHENIDEKAFYIFLIIIIFSIGLIYELFFWKYDHSGCAYKCASAQALLGNRNQVYGIFFLSGIMFGGAVFMVLGYLERKLEYLSKKKTNETDP